MSQSIAIIDYGSGNLRSAAKSFEHVLKQEGMTGEVTITSDADFVRKADKIVLPGQGAFGDCISGLREVPGMVEALEEKVIKQSTPFFGICVGMQLMATRGLEFGEHKGLGWVAGDVVKMTPSDSNLKIPHMGWNTLEMAEQIHPVLHSITKNANAASNDFYFVHSFVFQYRDTKDVAAWCDYGGKFAAVVAKDNMIGCQFHPEKSQNAGLDLIRGFLHWKP